MSPGRAMRRHRRPLPVPAAAPLLVFLLLAVHTAATRSLSESNANNHLSTAAPASSIEESRNPIASKIHTSTNFPNDQELETKPMVASPLLIDYVVKKRLPLYKKEREYSNEKTVVTFLAPDSSFRVDDDTFLSPSKRNFQKKPYHYPLENHYEEIMDFDGGDRLLSNEANVENADTAILDQEMVESEIVLQRTESKSRCCHRFKRSPITNRNSFIISPNQEEGKQFRSNSFLFGTDYSDHQQVGSQESEFAVISTLYSLELSDAVPQIQDQISDEQYVPGDTLIGNNGQGVQLRQTPIWNLRFGNNVPPEVAIYETNYRPVPELQENRNEKAYFATKSRDFSTLGVLYNSKDTKAQESMNSVLQSSISNKRSQLGNKKRDLSPQYMTLGENNGIERTTSLRASEPAFSSKSNDHTLGNTLAGLFLARTEVSQRAQEKQSIPAIKQLFVSIPPQESSQFSEQLVHEHLVSISPFSQTTTDYDRLAFSAIPPAQEYSSASSLPQHSALHQYVGEQSPGFELESGNNLRDGNIFHSDIELAGMISPANSQGGVRLFKRSAAPEALIGGEARHLFQEAEEYESGKLSAALSKRSPLATGYVAGIGSGPEHHHNHLSAAGGLVHQEHHHDGREFDSSSYPY